MNNYGDGCLSDNSNSCDLKMNCGNGCCCLPDSEITECNVDYNVDNINRKYYVLMAAPSQFSNQSMVLGVFSTEENANKAWVSTPFSKLSTKMIMSFPLDGNPFLHNIIPNPVNHDEENDNEKQ